MKTLGFTIAVVMIATLAVGEARDPLRARRRRVWSHRAQRAALEMVADILNP